MDLIADIGATNARCALIDDDGRTIRSDIRLNRDFPSLESVLGSFIDGASVRRAALAIAGPIAGDDVAMLNIDWTFSRKALARNLGLETLLVLNDFEALAHALPGLRDADCHPLGGGNSMPNSPMAVLGPGSGLGVATAVPCGDGWTAVGGEGGHVTLAPQTDTEAAIIGDYRDATGHCSAERLLSGPGLARIYASLATRAGRDDIDRTPDAVTDGAARGDAVAVETYAIFFALLGAVAGNLALTVGARGGVYIGGGIVPRVLGLLENSPFRERFIGKGRYRGYLDAIPTAVITAPTPAFLGLRKVLGQC